VCDGLCGIAVKSKLAVENFSVVLEDDGSSVCDDVMNAIIEDGEKLGTLMVLKDSQKWTCGLYFNSLCCCKWLYGVFLLQGELYITIHSLACRTATCCVTNILYIYDPGCRLDRRSQ